MTTLTVSAEPVLRRLPVPATEPDPVLRVVPDGGTCDILPSPPGTVLGPRPAQGLARSAGATDRPEAASARTVPQPAAIWARQFIQAALEAATGRRPVSQLVRWTSEEVFAVLNRRAALATRRGPTGKAPSGPCLVRSVRLCRPTTSAVEASAVVLDRGRYRAVALRLEDADGRWRVSALEIG